MLYSQNAEFGNWTFRTLTHKVVRILFRLLYKALFEHGLRENEMNITDFILLLLLPPPNPVLYSSHLSPLL